MTDRYIPIQTEENVGKEKKAYSRLWWLPATMMFARFSVWIAGPVIIALYTGKWLDREYGTAPWLFLGTIGLAFCVSMFGIAVSALKEFKKIEKENGKNKNLNDKDAGN